MLTKRKILVVVGIIVAILITFYTGIFGMSAASQKTHDFANEGTFVNKPGISCPSFPGFYEPITGFFEVTTDEWTYYPDISFR